ncbi:hypothetical protein MBANPS3_011861 [Mucor bainieri]
MVSQNTVLSLNSVLDLTCDGQSALFAENEWETIKTHYSASIKLKTHKLNKKIMSISKALGTGDLEKAYCKERKLEIENLDTPDERLYSTYAHILKVYRRRNKSLVSRNYSTELDGLAKIWVEILEDMCDHHIEAKWQVCLKMQQQPNLMINCPNVEPKSIKVYYMQARQNQMTIGSLSLASNVSLNPYTFLNNLNKTTMSSTEATLATVGNALANIQSFIANQDIINRNTEQRLDTMDQRFTGIESSLERLLSLSEFQASQQPSGNAHNYPSAIPDAQSPCQASTSDDTQPKTTWAAIASKPSAPLTDRKRQALHRAFNPPNDSSQNGSYTFVYMFRSRRMNRAQIRSKFRLTTSVFWTSTSPFWNTSRQVPVLMKK